VCTRVPHPSRPGKRRTTVREAAATTGAVLVLAEQLAGEGIEMITLEATGVIRGANMMKLDIAQVGPWRTRPRR